MKRFSALLAAVMLVVSFALPVMAYAETVADIAPDPSQWGISRTKFKELNGKDFEDVIIGENKGLSGGSIEIDGYNMKVYYDFATPQKSFSGLTRIVFLVDSTKKISNSNLTKCYNALAKDVKQYDEPVESTKKYSVWLFQDFTLEIAIGDYSAYSQVKNDTVALIFSDPELTEEGEAVQPKNGKTKNMTVDVAASCSDYNSVGEKWMTKFFVNGKAVQSGSQISLAAGDEITVKAEITEDDQSPDIGTNAETHTVTQADLDKGFNIRFSVDVTENKGRYSGHTATWSVSFKFK